ncbi:hypothetical protein AHF37_04349 [Paragonimus kellicotti]|nr:hypothetical protein AHF37_04349 [Paragonimus kellicotti]
MKRLLTHLTTSSRKSRSGFYCCSYEFESPIPVFIREPYTWHNVFHNTNIRILISELVFLFKTN